MSDYKPMTEEELVEAETSCEAFDLPLVGIDYETSRQADEDFISAAEKGWPRALAEVRRLRNENQQLRTAIPFPGMRATNLKRLADDIAEIPLGRAAFIEVSLLADHLTRLDKLLMGENNAQ